MKLDGGWNQSSAEKTARAPSKCQYSGPYSKYKNQMATNGIDSYSPGLHLPHVQESRLARM